MKKPTPSVPQRPHKLSTHGDSRIDPWLWLRDVNDPETLEYLRAENAHTEAVMAPEEELQERLYQEMRSRIKEEDSTVPQKEGDKWLAYSVDSDGSEQYTIVFKNLETGELLDEAIPNSYYSLEWANDSQTTAASSCPGDDPSNDGLVYEDKDELFFIRVTKSASKRFIFVISSGNNMSEWHFMESDDPNGGLTLIQPRRQDFEYDVDHHGDRFLIRNNGDGAKDFKVSETLISTPGLENWKDLVPHVLGRPIRGIGVSQDYFVLYYRANGLPQVQITDFSTGTSHDLTLEEEDYSVRLQGSREAEWVVGLCASTIVYLAKKFPIAET